MSFDYRGRPAVRRRIAAINPEQDRRVRLVGRVIEQRPGSFMLDDRSSVVEVVSDIPASGLVCVFCRVLQLESGSELRAEIVQDMTGLDEELHQKIWS